MLGIAIGVGMGVGIGVVLSVGVGGCEEVGLEGKVGKACCAGNALCIWGGKLFALPGVANCWLAVLLVVLF